MSEDPHSDARVQPSKSNPHGHPVHDFTGPLQPRTRRIIQVFVALSAVLLGLDLFVHREAHLSIEKMPGFYAVYGFLGCVALVLAAKEMRKVLMRREDYYDGPR